MEERIDGLPKVAVLGLGKMGSAMVQNLSASAFDVAIYNRTHEVADSLAELTGAVAFETPAGAVAGVDVAITSLADDEAVRAVILGSDGVASGLPPNSVVLEMSTINPKTLRDIEPSITAAGAALVDAPVSGSVQLVLAGTLTVMAGGDADAIERARPVLESLSARIFHVGDGGSGATVKLAVNTIVHSLNVALSEALVLAEKAGVDRSLAYEVFATGVAGAPFVGYKREAFEQPENAPVAFRLDLVAKDLTLILELASDVGVEMDQAMANKRVTERAIEAGYGADDMSSIARYLRNTD